MWREIRTGTQQQGAGDSTQDFWGQHVQQNARVAASVRCAPNGKHEIIVTTSASLGI